MKPRSLTQGSVSWAVLVVTLLPARQAVAQTDHFSDSLLTRIRMTASMMPGQPPHAVHVFTFNRFQAPESYVLQNGAERPISGANTVFQIRFPDDWIMVDAGMDPEVAHDTTASFRSAYDQVQTALSGARSIVVTHEHHDHVAGVIHTVGPTVPVEKTLLTRTQIQTLMERPNTPLVRLDSASASRYPRFDYDVLYPLAAGVVLVKTPGHTPGSQMVYVRLASGNELLLIGDVAWMMAGVEQRRQKPEAVSRALGEDRLAIQRQLEWIHALTAGTDVTVVNGHDEAWIVRLVAAGTLREGLHQRQPPR